MAPSFPRFEMPNVHEGFSIVYQRISLSKLTIIYFAFSLLFAIVSVLLQSQAYQTNLAAANLFTTVLARSNSSTSGFALLERRGDELLWCTGYGNSRCQSLWSADIQRSRNPGEPSQTSSTVPALSSNAPAADATQAATPASGPVVVNNQVVPLGPLITQISQAAASPLAIPAANPVPSTPPTVLAAFANQPVDDDDDDDANEVDDDDDDDDDDDEVRAASIAQGNRIFNKRSPLSHTTSSRPQDDTPHPKGVEDLVKRQRTVILVTKEDGNTTAQVELNGATLILDQRCLLALNWPLETLENTKREDIVFIIFHIWVFGLSVVALLNESVVHMLANLFTHVLVAIWAAFQLVHTRAFQTNFSRIVTNGLCDGQNLLPRYWQDRARSEIPTAAINALALVVCAALTWRLIRTYNWATFKRIGADRKISKVYKIVLSLSTVLQLSAFFILVSIALWIDQLCNGVFGQFAKHMVLYRGLYISIAILLVPWIVLGWKAARTANRLYMSIFIGFNVFLVGGWGAMFSSVTFRYTFFQWTFFMLMEIAAVVLLVASLWLSIWSRMNFDVDLSRWLNPKNDETDDNNGVTFVGAGYPIHRTASKDSFQSMDEDEKRVGDTSYDEKIDYPFSNGNGGVPTYAAFTRNPSVPAPPPSLPPPNGQLGFLGNSGPSLHDTSLQRKESEKTTTSLARSVSTKSTSTVGTSESSRRKYLLE